MFEKKICTGLQKRPYKYGKGVIGSTILNE